MHDFEFISPLSFSHSYKLYSTNLFATSGTKMQWQLLIIKGHPDNLKYALSILLLIVFEIETQY